MKSYGNAEDLLTESTWEIYLGYFSYVGTRKKRFGEAYTGVQLNDINKGCPWKQRTQKLRKSESLFHSRYRYGTRVLQNVSSLGSDYFSATFY